MTAKQNQLEILSAENASLQEKLRRLENDVSKREYFQGLKERPFWVDKPNVWFSIVEAEFKVAGIVDDLTKYSYVISQLDEDVTSEVKDIITNPPIRGKYLKIKDELKRRLSEPERERYRKLFNDKLGNKTPSQFYRHLNSLVGPNVTVDKILLHLWLRRLPLHCQQILASRLEQTNYKLTEIADNILEATTAAANSKSAENSVINNIQLSVDELAKQVVSLGGPIKRRESRSQSPAESQSESQTETTETAPKTCWYHVMWGASAYRCIAPCDWKKTETKEEEKK